MAAMIVADGRDDAAAAVEKARDDDDGQHSR